MVEWSEHCPPTLPQINMPAWLLLHELVSRVSVSLPFTAFHCLSSQAPVDRG